MAAGLEIFVAYSGKGGAKRRREVKALLESRHHAKVTGDDVIPTLTEWHKALLHMLSHCHGAVLVLNDASLVPGYQTIEATVLSLRWCARPDKFPLVVLFDGASVKKLKAHAILKWLELERYQQISTDEADWQEKLAGAFSDVAHERALLDTPKHRRAGMVFDKLSQLAAEKIKCDRLADLARAQLGLPSVTGGCPVSSSTLLAQVAIALIETVNADRCCDAIRAMKDAVHCPDTLRAVLRIAAPGWIDGDAAAVVQVTLFREPGKRFLSLHIEESLIFDLYLARAFETDLDNRPKAIGVIAPGENPVQASHWAIADFFWPEQDPQSIPEHKIKGMLAHREEKRLPVILSYPRDYPTTSRLISALAKKLGTVSFAFFVSPESTPPGDAVMVVPVIGAKAQLDIDILYRSLVRDLTPAQ